MGRRWTSHRRLGWLPAVALSLVVSLAQTGRAQTRPIQAPPLAGPEANQLDPPAVPTTAVPSSAAPASAAQAIESLTEKVNARLEQVQADSEAAAEDKESLVKLYQQVLADLQAAADFQRSKVEWNERAAAAPAKLESARARKAEDAEQIPEEPAPDFKSFEEGQTRLQSLEAQLAAATEQRESFSEQTTSREKRRQELPQLISESKTQLEQVVSTPATEPVEDPLVQEAIGWAADAAKSKLTEQVKSLESEQRAYEAEVSLLPLQVELAEGIQRRLQEQVRRVNSRLEKINESRILTAQSEVYDLIQDLPPPLQERGTTLLERTQAWLELASKHANVKQELETSRAVYQHWKEQKAKMLNRVEPEHGPEGASGFNAWVGLMLRKQSGELPDPNQLASRIRYVQDQVQQADSLLFDLEDELYQINSEQDALKRTRAASGGGRASADPLDSSDTGRLLQKGEEIIGAMTIDVKEYLTDLYDLADVQDNTIKQSNAYRALIDKHVLWIRSCDPLGRSDWQHATEALRWLLYYDNWRSCGLLLLSDAARRPWWYGLFAVGWLVLLGNQAGLRRRLGQLSAKAEKKTCTDFQLTAHGFLTTMLIAAPAPLLLLFGFWSIDGASRATLVPEVKTEFAISLAKGLLLAAAIWFPLELLRQICRLDGLGNKHFDWQQAISQRLAKNLRWLIDFSILLAVVIGLLASHGDPRWESSLGRAAFILLMPLVSIFFARVFAPSTGILSGYLQKNSGGWLNRLRFIWYFGLVMGPLVLVVVSLTGYHYTAQRIAIHLDTTLWAVVVLTTFYCLLMRWLVLNRRKIMMAQARQRLEEAARRGQQAESESSGLIEESPEVNLVAINEQTKRLVTSLVVATGLATAYYLWSDILPAISLLDRFELWTVQGDIAGERVPITWADLLLVVPIIILVVIAGRNLPGLLEIALLQHLPITNAARYAVITLSRYAIFAIGIISASATIGLRWSSVQWLVAALGVGLGFGLQEIFANFVSGVILLFEQPIRVGDIITIDGTTGTVQKIRIRATTIVNWDRQELIIPNRELITGKLLNWTLSDTTNRVVVNVGVAYGSDTRVACDLIRKVCEEHPNIMNEPGPIVTFEGFGDNTLNLVLRAYLETLDNRLGTVHELHEQIYLAFNAANIEIAFPQRDLHIRSLPEQVSRWLGGQRQESPVACDSSANHVIQK